LEISGGLVGGVHVVVIDRELALSRKRQLAVNGRGQVA
jgi:hypothetical protein